MKSSHKYSGIISEGERYQDNIEFYQKQLEEKQKNNSGRIPELRKLIQDIKFHKTIDHSKTHTRIISHVIDVYQIQNPVWDFTGRATLTPSGNLKHVSNIDLEKVLLNGALIDFSDENVQNAKKYLDISFSGLRYSFNLPKLSPIKDLFEFKIKTSVVVDADFVISDKIEYAYPVFTGLNFSEKRTPRKFQKWNYVKNILSEFLLAQ